jgi:SAM-dependent methyltransferase
MPSKRDWAHHVMTDGLYVQFGCGFSCAEGWLNFDSSPSLRLERLPIVGGLIRVNETRFPALARHGDVTRGLPVASGAAVGVYASHVLEHLARADAEAALAEAHRLLRPGGVFRIVVPDLRGRAEAYLAAASRGDGDAGDGFMRSTLLGVESRPASLVSWVKRTFGGSAHLWMWDEPSLTAALHGAGFSSVRTARLGDADDAMFDRVEHESRFFWSDGTPGAPPRPEVALHAVK